MIVTNIVVTIAILIFIAIMVSVLIYACVLQWKQNKRAEALLSAFAAVFLLAVFIDIIIGGGIYL